MTNLQELYGEAYIRYYEQNLYKKPAKFQTSQAQLVEKVLWTFRQAAKYFKTFFKSYEIL